NSLFSEHSRNLVGMIHLDALPGAPDYCGDIDTILRKALTDAKTLVDAGFDGLMVENYNDVPFYKDKLPPESIAALTRCALEIKRAYPQVPLGVNALRNDALSALSIAHITQCEFIRVNVLCGAVVTDQGLIEGCAAQLLRLKRSLSSNVAIWADLDVKHAQPLAAYDDEQFLSDLVVRGRADCVILSGTGTGQPTCAKRVNELVKRASVPVAVGSGINEDNLSQYEAHVLIVGTALKENYEIVAHRAEALVRLRNALRAD
ncbi:MAG: BtpA/SgcQ family protein, partial [Bradymonadia bacterium]